MRQKKTAPARIQEHAMNKPVEPNSFRTGPDEQGMFGMFGGRFVAETLMPLILDLERHWNAAKTDPAFKAELDHLNKHYTGRPSPLYFAERLTAASRRRQDLLQARRAQPHRLAQDQQLPRPDPARQAHGQDPHHRRDRRRPARRRLGHRVGALRPALRGLYGRHRRAAAGAQRVPHEAARRRGAAGDVRPRHAEGRHERGAARLGHQCRRHLLHDRHGGRAAPLSGNGARPAVGDRPRGQGADPRGRRPAARHDRRGRRRRLQRHRPVPPLPRRPLGAGSSASRPAARGWRATSIAPR